MACSSLLSSAATISSPLHSDSAGVTHRVHLSLSSDSRFFPILLEQESQGLDLQSSYNGFCTSRGSIKAGFGRGGSYFGVRFLPPSVDCPDICDCASCKRNNGFSCSKNGGCVRRACCFRVRAHSALLASSPPGRMGGCFRVWALSASLAYPPAGRREDCTRVRALSSTVASSLKKTDTASPANPNPSLTWGIIPHPPEASQKVIDYLRSKGIDTTELEDVELPSSIEVMQERLEFLTKIGLSMETINSYPLMVTCSIKKNLIPVLDYLEQLGFRSRDLPSFLEKYPMVLHSSVVIDLMPVIDYLLGLDIQRKDIHHVLMRFPDVLGFRLEGTMSTSVAYLVSIGVRPRSIGRMLTEYPEILGMRVANTIKPKVDLLLSHGIPKSIVARILEKRPYILGFDFNDTMQPAVDDLLEAGVKREAISAIITQYPDILGQSIKENLTQKTRWLVQQVKVAPCDVPRIIEKLPQVLFIKEGLAMERVTYFLRAGCSADDVAKMVTVCPQLLAMSISQALEPSLNFLRQDMKRSVKEVVKFPTYFTYDLKSRIMPRYKLIAEKGIDCSLEWFLNCSEQKFKVRLDADYIDDEDSGPVFQMGGPVFTENEQGEELISAEGDSVSESDEQSWQQVRKRQQPMLSQEGGRKAVKLQHERTESEDEDESDYEVFSQAGSEDEEDLDMSESASEFDDEDEIELSLLSVGKKKQTVLPHRRGREANESRRGTGQQEKTCIEDDLRDISRARLQKRQDKEELDMSESASEFDDVDESGEEEEDDDDWDDDDIEEEEDDDIEEEEEQQQVGRSANKVQR